jgi:hypothetical protein
MHKSRGVVIFGSILAALQFLAAASALSDMIGKETFGIFVIAVGAIQIGWSFYQEEQVIPYQDAAAYVDRSGQVVAGPAGGVTNGKLVDVTESHPVPGQYRDPAQPSPQHYDERGNIDPLTALVVIIGLVVLVALFAFLIPSR